MSFHPSLKGNIIAYDNKEPSSGLSATFSHSPREQEKGLDFYALRLLSEAKWEKGEIALCAKVQWTFAAFERRGMRALSHPMR